MIVTLAVYVVLVAVAVLSPISYAGVIATVTTWLVDGLGLPPFGNGWVEFLANTLMFVPLGLLLTLLLRHHWWGAALALVISIGVEIVQIVIPSRMPSLRDVLANGLGALLGALLAWLFGLRRDRRRAKAAAPTSVG